MIRKTSTNWK